MRYFIELQYNGSAFCGWQRQTDRPSVQQTIEQALSTLLRHEIAITGAGRTDTGVHALYYVAHFDTETPLPDPAHTVYKANLLLPEGVALRSIAPVNDEAHARFSALSREYRYIVSPRKNPFTRDTSWQYYVPLDTERMNRAAAALLEYEDFTSFAKLNSNNRTNICRIDHAAWTTERDGTLRFTIRADRFLRNMVRAIVGTLAEVGRGKIPPEAVMDIIARKDRCAAGTSMPGHALYLWDITYPYYRPDASEFVTAL